MSITVILTLQLKKRRQLRLRYCDPCGLGSPESCEVPGGWVSRVPFSSLAEWKTLLPQQPPKAREQPLLELLPG